MAYALTREEQETVIRCSAADHSWDVVTADGRMKTKLRRAGYEGKPDHQLSAPFEKFEIPFNALSIRSQKGLEAHRAAAVKRGARPPQPGKKSTENEATRDANG
jgi:hypothetical protein